ncbi:MAG: SMC family ATPase [Methanomassiliicoccales archaeon]|nr:MAG: SMC family ATPase [Methanomassiliicoccales archaeon]
MKTLEDFISDESIPVQPLEEQIPETKIIAEPAEGFIIKEIEMKGFMRYVEKTVPSITFPNKFTVITGKTGSGKTSILDAITFALYKRTSRTDIQNIKISDVCRPQGHVKVSFFQNGEEYEVERGFSSSSSPYLTLRRNNKAIEGNIKELEKIIEEVIGLDYDGFRNSTFVRQEEMKELGAESAAKRLEIFQKLFRLETFEKAQALASEKSEIIKKNAGNLETEMNIRNEQIVKLSLMEKELGQKRNFIDAEKKKLKELGQKIENLNEELEVLAEKHDEFSALKGKRESINERLKKTEKRLAKANKDGKNIMPLRKEIAALKESIKDYEALHNQGEKLREKQHNHQTIKRELDRDIALKKSLITERDAGIKRLFKRIDENEKRISNLSTEIGKDEAFAMLRNEGSLSERITRIEKEIRWLNEKKEFVTKLKKERGEAEKELYVLSRKTKSINEDSFILSEIEANITQTRKDIEELNKNYEKKIKDIDEEITGGGRNIKKLGFGGEEKKKIAEIRSKVAKMQKSKNELEKKRRKLDEIGDPTSLIEDLETQKKSMEDELEKLKERIIKLKSEEERYQKTKQRFEKMQKDKEKLFGEMSREEGEINRLEDQINELKNLKKQMAEKEKELKELREKNEIYSILKEKVFHKRGIVMYAIDQLLPQLSLETSTNLFDMTDGRFSKVKLGSYQENNRYGIRIEVAGADGKWHDVQEFSGGEKTQINAALRFAIAKELASMPQVGRTYGRMKTLFIDEGDLGSLDTESSRQLFVKKLFSMGEFFEKIILITHLSEVAEKFPGRIMVYMTPEEESRIKVMA